MPSTNKTPFLGLNKWQASDKPKMSDFNGDNQLIDQALQQHTQDTQLHLTAEEKDMLSRNMSVGFYTGDNQPERAFSLGFTPRFIIVFADSYPVSFWDGGTKDNNSYCAMATLVCGTVGIDLIADGFKIYHTSTGVSDFPASRMNLQNVKYSYVAFQ